MAAPTEKYLEAEYAAKNMLGRLGNQHVQNAEKNAPAREIGCKLSENSTVKPLLLLLL